MHKCGVGGRRRHVETDGGIPRIYQVVYIQTTIRYVGCFVVTSMLFPQQQTEFSFVVERILNDGGRDLMLPRTPNGLRRRWRE